METWIAWIAWIALIRGINVSGKRILKMAELKSDLEALKLKNVRTYIQSGNIVFDSTEKSAPTLAKQIAAQIEECHGFRPHLFLLSPAELMAAVEANPFPKAVSDPKTLHFLFLAEPAWFANIEALDNAKASTESYRLAERIFYLHAPDGVGRSKLAANAEKYLGVVTTARNYRTVEKLLSMVNQG